MEGEVYREEYILYMDGGQGPQPSGGSGPSQGPQPSGGPDPQRPHYSIGQPHLDNSTEDRKTHTEGLVDVLRVYRDHGIEYLSQTELKLTYPYYGNRGYFESTSQILRYVRTIHPEFFHPSNPQSTRLSTLIEDVGRLRLNVPKNFR